ncbi:MAG: hypothetical protein WC393_02675 [Candidatus Nanoarchaeia archaeon]|jgi:hypothetical protein
MKAEIYKPRNEINYSVKITQKELDLLKEGVGLVGILNENEFLGIIVEKNANYAMKENETILITPYELEMLEKNKSWCARFDFYQCRDLIMKIIPETPEPAEKIYSKN